jgi:hypothetical protein
MYPASKLFDRVRRVVALEHQLRGILERNDEELHLIRVVFAEAIVGIDLRQFKHET